MKVGRTGKNSKPCSVMQAAMISWMRVAAASASSRLPGSISAVICSITPSGCSATASGTFSGWLQPGTAASARAASAAARAVRWAALMGSPPTSRPTRRARRGGRPRTPAVRRCGPGPRRRGSRPRPRSPSPRWPGRSPPAPAGGDRPGHRGLGLRGRGRLPRRRGPGPQRRTAGVRGRPPRRARRVGREVGGEPMSAAHRTALAAALAALALAAVPGCSHPEKVPDAVAEQPLGVIEQITAEIDPGNLEDAEAAATRIQEIIAACMTEQGFEFFPVRPTFIDGQEQEDYLAEQLGVRPGTLEYAQQYGYGLSTHAYREMPEPSAPPNPNEQVLEAMSDAERQAWGSAMFGESQADDDLASQGCWGRASYEVYEAPPEGLDLEPFAPLQAEIDTMFGSLQNHPRQLDLDSRWMACMAEAGQPEFDSPADAIDSITAEWDGFRGIGPSDQVAKFTSREIAVATADFTCQDEVEYAATQRQISIDVQQEFYDAHKAELDAWVEAALALRSRS